MVEVLPLCSVELVGELGEVEYPTLRQGVISGVKRRSSSGKGTCQEFLMLLPFLTLVPKSGKRVLK